MKNRDKSIKVLLDSREPMADIIKWPFLSNRHQLPYLSALRDYFNTLSSTLKKYFKHNFFCVYDEEEEDIDQKMNLYNLLFIYEEQDREKRDQYIASNLASLLTVKDSIASSLDEAYEHIKVTMGTDLDQILTAITGLRGLVELLEPLRDTALLIQGRLFDALARRMNAPKIMDMSSALSHGFQMHPEDLCEICLQGFSEGLRHRLNGIIIVTNDPHDVNGGMCRIWGWNLPFFLFSPYYGGYLSAITFIHEFGHLRHYLYHQEKSRLPSFCALQEEFFAIYFVISPCPTTS
jgi:hypothetical protein